MPVQSGCRSFAIRSQFFLITAVLIVQSVFALPAQAVTKRPVTLDDLTQTAMAEALQLSPDGKMLAYSFAHWSNYLTDENVWIVETKAGAQPRKIATGTLPRWSPDGKKLAYYSGPAGDFQIWIFDLASGRSEQVTHVKGGINPDPYSRIMGYVQDAMALAWSPDSKKIMFASRVPSLTKNKLQESASPAAPAGSSGHPAPIVLTLTTPPEWTTAGIYAPAFGSSSAYAHWQKREDADPSKPAKLQPVLVNQLFLLDVATKKIEQFTTGDANYFGPAWSPDGSKIVCASSEGSLIFNFGSGKTQLYVFDVASRKKTQLTNEPEVKWKPSWSPDGKTIVYLSGAFNAMQQLMAIPAAGGSPRSLTASLDRYVEEYRWAGGAIYMLLKDGVSHPVLRVEPDGTQLTWEVVEKALRIDLSSSRNGALAWQQSDGAHAGGIWFKPSREAKGTELVDLNPQVQSWEIGKQVVITWKNKRGEEIEGILITPPGYVPGKKYPMIVDDYPGTSAQFRGDPYGGNHAWAAHGYVVLFTSGARGPHVWMNPIKGRKYNLEAKGPHGWDVTYDDVMSGVDAMIRRGIADPNRIGLFGFSNGGAIAQMLITRTNRFKCAVAYAGVPMADLTRAYFSYPGWEGVIGESPWDDPAGYVELSSIYRLNKVNTPVLLFDGSLDGDFVLNTIEVYNGLRDLGKDVTFVRYPGQAHVFTGWALKDFLHRTLAFYDAHLKQ